MVIEVNSGPSARTRARYIKSEWFLVSEMGIPPSYNVYALKSLRYRNANSSYEQGLDIDIIDFMDPVCSITDTAYPIACPLLVIPRTAPKKKT